MTELVITILVMIQRTVSEILEEWPDRRAVLDDARVADSDLALIAVHRWVKRQSIPSKYWHALILGAASRGIPVSADELALAHAPKGNAA